MTGPPSSTDIKNFKTVPPRLISGRVMVVLRDYRTGRAHWMAVVKFPNIFSSEF
jgi:hypothetical protein